MYPWKPKSVSFSSRIEYIRKHGLHTFVSAQKPIFAHKIKLTEVTCIALKAKTPYWFPY